MLQCGAAVFITVALQGMLAAAAVQVAMQAQLL
jgi:hypothetical protein